MRRGRILILILLIVVVGLGVLYLFYNQFTPTGGGVTPASQPAATKQVYYAAQNIPQGTVITQEMLGTYSFPPESVAEVMFEVGEEANLVGQTARYTLEQGTVITTSMVGSAPSEVAGPSWAVQVPPGMVAVSIPTDRLATAAYGINDGAHVNVNVCMTFVDVDPSYQSALPNYLTSVRDIYFPPTDRPFITIDPAAVTAPQPQGRTELDPTFQKPVYVIPSEAQRPRLVCQTILQDVTVLKLGNFSLTAEQVLPSQQEQPATEGQPAVVTQQSPDIITLMVSPQDSISLNYFVYSGAVFSMALRNPNDPSRIEAQSATLTSILSQYNISLPSKLPYALQHRVDSLVPPVLPNDAAAQQPQQ